MNQPGAILRGNKIRQNNKMRRFVRQKEGKEGTVLFAFQVFSLKSFHNPEVFPTQYLLHQWLRQDQPFHPAFGKGSFHRDIFNIR